MKKNYSPIGVFDSGYGGLTIFSEIANRLPQYDFIYLADNARSPYGGRSFDLVYKFTEQACEWLFNMGCPLIIFACNTVSAKALRNIQQKYLVRHFPDRRALGVIRPTVEVINDITLSNHVGVFATEGTVFSRSYTLEINKLYPDISVVEQSCPMWVSLIENHEIDNEAMDYFIHKYANSLLSQDPEIDTIILGCTHYPIIEERIKKFLPRKIKLFSQGKRVAESLEDYLLRHPEIDSRCTKNGRMDFYTTERPEKFSKFAEQFLKKEVITAKSISLE